MRIRTLILAASAVGVAGAAWSEATDLFVVVFCGLFWFTVACLLFMWGRAHSADHRVVEHPAVHGFDPWIDTHDVHHAFGDVFDRENHPRPGAHDRI